MKKKIVENKKFRLIAVFLVTVFIVGGFSLAWFYMRKNQYEEMSVSNLQATPVCYFEGNESEHLTGLIELSTDPDADNYFGKFHVDVNYSGDGAGYLRVRIVHEFTNGKGSVAVQHPSELPYTISDLWYDNRSNDYCYYYQGTQQDKGKLDAEGVGNTRTIQLITGGLDAEGTDIISGFHDADAVITVAVEADMVQINRYPQIWGINKLPWK